MSEESLESVAALKALLPQLRALGLTSVTVPYYGSGDEGQCDSDDITYAGETKETELPDDLAQQLTDLTEAIVSDLRGNWEDNEGGEGNVTIDVAAGKVVLHHAYYETTPNYEEPEEL